MGAARTGAGAGLPSLPGATPPPVGPARIPPRPDLGSSRRRRWPAWVALVAAVAALAVLASQVVGPRSPVALLAPPAAERGEYAFLGRSPDGPYRWNPCRPITYQVNLAHAPPGALADVREAVRRVAEATGIRFVDGGTTTRTADMQLGRAFRGRAPGEPHYYPVLIDWVPHERFVYLADSKRAVAFGMPYRGQGAEARTYVSGLVAMDAGADLDPGFEHRFSRGVVLMHELAHVIGLDHVGAPHEIMWSAEASRWSLPDLGQTEWGPGDLEGLRRLGVEAGCPWSSP